MKSVLPLALAICLVMICLILMAAPMAEAQEVASSFEQLRVLVKPGDTVKVTETSGRETTGKIADLSSSSLGLLVAGTRQDFAESEVTTIRQRRHGSLATGAKWGFGVGVSVGVVGRLAESGDHLLSGAGWDLLIAATWGGLGAGIGVGISAMTSHQHVIYARRATSSAAVTVSPLLTRERKGMLVSLGF